MFSLPFITASLYPNKSKEDLAAMTNQCAATALEYESAAWQSVQREDLQREEIQLNLVRTLWQTQFYYHGIVTDILLSLEHWSDDSTLSFADFDETSQAFCQRYYGFLGFVHIGNLNADSVVKLLGSRFLVLATAWGIPIYVNLQEYFARYVNVFGLARDADFFVIAMRQNKTALGEDGKVLHTVGEWIERFMNFFGTSPERRVEEFFADNVEIDRLSADMQRMLKDILTVYYGLKGGFIWREIENIVPAGYERTDLANWNVDERYLELLSGFDPQGIRDWLESYIDVVGWLAATQKSESYVNRLFYILTQKVDLKDDEQVALLSEFIHAMQENGWGLGADMLYFDEETGQFKWNQEIVSVLKEEVEYLQSRPGGEETTPTAAAPQPPKDIAPGIQELLP